MPAPNADKDFDFAVPSLGGEPSDRRSQILGSWGNAQGANLRSSLNPSIYFCRAVEKRFIAGGGSDHSLCHLPQIGNPTRRPTARNDRHRRRRAQI